MTASSETLAAVARHRPIRVPLSLRWRFVLLVLASSLPLLAFSVGVEYLRYRDDAATTGRQTLALARSMSLLCERELESRLAALQVLARSRFLPDDLAGFRKQAAAVVAEQFPQARISLLRWDGQELVNIAIAPGEPLPIRPYLGTIRQVATTGQPAVSNVFADAAGRPVVTIDVPVRGNDGDVAYILSLTPHLDGFARLIRHQQLPASWVVSVFDRNGVNVARVPNGEQFVGHPASPSLLRPLQAEREGIVESTSLEGTPLLSVFSHASRFGWAIAIGVPRAEVTAPAWAEARRILWAGAVLLLASLLLALYAARRIADPIESLHRFASAARGDELPALSATGLPEADAVAAALRKAEEDRRRSERTTRILSDAIEAMPVGLTLYDPEDRLILANRHFRSTMGELGANLLPGASFEEVMRRRLAAGEFPEATGREDEWLAERIGELHAPFARYEQPWADGRWLLVTRMRMQAGYGVSLVIDITDLKKTEAALRQSEQRFRDFAEVSGDVLWETDRDYRMKSGTGLLGDTVPIDPQTVIGKTPWEAAGADPATDPLWAAHKADLDARRPFRHFRHRVTRPGRPPAFLAVSGKPLFDEHGDFIGYRGVATDETAIVEAGHRAEQAETLLRESIESISAGFVVCDPDDRIILFNRQASEFFPDCADTLRLGAPYRDFLWARVEKGYYPQAAGREEAWFAEALARHREGQNEVEVALLDGRSLLVTERRMPDGSIAGVAVDVTALKRVQQALVKSESRFRLVVESAPSALLMINRAGAIELVNELAERVFGYNRGELLGKPVELLLPQRYRRDHPRLRAGFFAAPEPRSIGAGRDLYGLRKDGREIPVEIGLTPIETEDGLMVLASVIDITQRKQAERELHAAHRRTEAMLQALRRQEELLNRAQHLAHMGSFLTNLQTGEAEWSDETFRIFGVVRGEFQPTTESFLELVHPDDRAAVLAARDQLVRGSVPAPFEFRIIRPDGAVRQIYRENELIVDDNGNPLYLSGTIHDVTERRQTEAHLRQAQKMEALGTLAGGIAHDINNCLVPIVSMSQLALESLPDGARERDYIELIREAGNRIRDLVRRILIFSRREEVAIAPVDLTVVFAEVVKLLRATLPATIELRSRAEPAKAIVAADAGQIEQVLLNLCVNAADAIGERRGGLVDVTLARADVAAGLPAVGGIVPPGRYYRLRVADNGCGMDAQTIARIFEPFYTTKAPGKGTGLGLAMAHSIIAAHAGHWRVSSQPGAGTSFEIYLPAAEDRQQER
jgi:PAS domain S-box-containing protein